MTYSITRQPHPLDPIWDELPETVGDAWDAIEALPDDYTNEEVDALVERATARLETLLALPARNVSDIATKLNLLFPASEVRSRIPVDMQALIEEFCGVINTGMALGRRQQSDEHFRQPVDQQRSFGAEVDASVSAMWEALNDERRQLEDKMSAGLATFEDSLSYVRSWESFKNAVNVSDGRAPDGVDDRGVTSAARAADHLLSLILEGGWLDVAHPDPKEQARYEAALVCIYGARDTLHNALCDPA